MDTQQLEKRWDHFLSESQRDFVSAYMVMRNIGATSKMLGISKTTASNYLADPNVLVGLRLAEKHTRESAVVTPEEVINDLRVIRDMAMGRLPTPMTRFSADDPEPVTHYVYKFDSGAANKAVENLGRVVGMFTDKKEIKIPTSDAQLRRKLEDLLGIPLDGEIEEGEFSEICDAQEAPFDLRPATQPSLDLANPPKGLTEALERLADNEIKALMWQVVVEKEEKEDRKVKKRSEKEQSEWLMDE